MLTGEICQALAIPTASSISSFVWQVIFYLWPWKWIWAVLILGIWVIREIITRNGTSHYNSKNGFSPAFNSFVGSGTFLGFQTILLLGFEKIFGESVYCMTWPYIIHFVVFASTGLFLYAIGFWPELRIFNNRRGGRSRRYKRRH